MSWPRWLLNIYCVVLAVFTGLVTGAASSPAYGLATTLFICLVVCALNKRT